MAENFIKVADEILKTTYLPAFREQINSEVSFICQKVAKNNKGYDGADTIESIAPVGLSGGFGFGDLSGYRTPEGRNIAHKRFKVNPAEYFVEITLLDRLIRSGKAEGALIDYMQKEIEGSYETAKWNLGRALYGNGTGILAEIGAVDGAILEVDTARNLIEGLLVDIYEAGTEVGDPPAAAHVRIEGISGRRTAAPKVYLDREVNVGAGAFITVQNSYGREITGIGAIFDDDIEEICGINKEDNPFVQPYVVDAENDLTDTLIRQALRASEDRNGKVDAIAMGTAAYDAFAEYVKANNIRMESGQNDIVAGFNTQKFRYGNKLIDIYEEKFLPEDEVWGIGTDDIEPHMTELDYVNQAPESGAFLVLPGTAVYRALLASYGNYIYTNPGGFFRIKNAAPTE